MEIHADSDDAGLFGTTDKAPGYSQIRYSVSTESLAPEKEIMATLDEAVKHSPWLDVFKRRIDCQREVRLVDGHD